MTSAGRSVGIEDCNCFVVRRAARQISRLYDAYLQPIGLRTTQFVILASVYEVGEAALNDLAEQLDIERTAMGKMVAVVEREGLVRVEASPVDARSRIITLTAAGKERLDQAVPQWRAAQDRFAELNGEEYAVDLRRNLAAMKATA